MNIEELRDYCLLKEGTTESFPFNEDVLVFKVKNKIYALLSLRAWESGEASINLKCNPERAIELRDQYSSIDGGYHMNKKHWNTITLSSGEISDAFLKELIDHSYNIIFQQSTKNGKR